MALKLFNGKSCFEILPPEKYISLFGKRPWDTGITSHALQDAVKPRTVFTMPAFGRHGRWGNMVFQYLFMQAIARDNGAAIELNRSLSWVNDIMRLYSDMENIPTVRTPSQTVILDNFQIFPKQLDYIPSHVWRALYHTKTAGRQCYLLDDAPDFLGNPVLPVSEIAYEVEGLFIFNTAQYTGLHKDTFLKQLLQPSVEFNTLIQNCRVKMGENKTVIGIHIRRGDFVKGALNQLFQYPIPVPYIIGWLKEEIHKWKDPLLLVCSDDANAYKEISSAGFPVVSAAHLLGPQKINSSLEQLEWELLRQADVLLTSNSTFSFSAALLSRKAVQCYQFSMEDKAFFRIDPWNATPLQFYMPPSAIFPFLFSRFKFVSEMVSKKSGAKRLVKDMRIWATWSMIRIPCLYFAHGYSWKWAREVFNLTGFFKVPNRNEWQGTRSNGDSKD